jgi:hypothetical protein
MLGKAYTAKFLFNAWSMPTRAQMNSNIREGMSSLRFSEHFFVFRTSSQLYFQEKLKMDQSGDEGYIHTEALRIETETANRFSQILNHLRIYGSLEKTSI